MFNLLSGAFDFAYVFKTITTRWYYYVFLAVAIIVIACFFFFKKQKNRIADLSKTKKVVYASVLTAFCVVANVFDVQISDALQISFVATVGFVAGYLLGGGYGFAVCFTGDLIGAIVNPHGPYNPVIGFGTGLWGLIPGVAFGFFKGNDKVKTIVSFIIGFLTISCGINTFGFVLMYPTMYTLEYCLAALPFKFIAAAANCACCLFLVGRLSKTFGKTGD